MCREKLVALGSVATGGEQPVSEGLGRTYRRNRLGCQRRDERLLERRKHPINLAILIAECGCDLCLEFPRPSGEVSRECFWRGNLGRVRRSGTVSSSVSKFSVLSSTLAVARNVPSVYNRNSTKLVRMKLFKVFNETCILRFGVSSEIVEVSLPYLSASI